VVGIVTNRGGSRQPWPPKQAVAFGPGVVTRKRWPKLLIDNGNVLFGGDLTGARTNASRGFTLRVGHRRFYPISTSGAIKAEIARPDPLNLKPVNTGRREGLDTLQRFLTPHFGGCHESILHSATTSFATVGVSRDA